MTTIFTAHQWACGNLCDSATHRTRVNANFVLNNSIWQYFINQVFQFSLSLDVIYAFLWYICICCFLCVSFYARLLLIIFSSFFHFKTLTLCQIDLYNVSGFKLLYYSKRDVISSSVSVSKQQCSVSILQSNVNKMLKCWTA